MKYKIWTLLAWIDNNINHTIVDDFFGLFPESNFMEKVWRNTSKRYCDWVMTEIEWSEE